MTLIYVRSTRAKWKIISVLMPYSSFSRLVSPDELSRKKFKEYCYLSACFFALLALAAPQWGVELAPVAKFAGNVVIAVDTSNSMLARDLKPSRIDNSKLMLKSLVEKFIEFRIGIVAFSGAAFVQCPLTSDTEALKYFISSLRAGMLPHPGTDIPAAITKSVELVSKISGDKILVLLTDGEDHSGNMDFALGYALKNSVRIFAVGIGDPAGELIPVLDAGGNVSDYKKDRDGKTVVTKLNESLLIKIARSTGGQYIHYNNPEAVSDEIHKAVENIKLAKTAGKSMSRYKNRYQIPLFMALLLFLIEFMIMEKRQKYE